MAIALFTKLKEFKDISIPLIAGVGASIVGLLKTWPGELMTLSIVLGFAALAVSRLVHNDKAKIFAKRTAIGTFAFSVIALAFLLVQRFRLSSYEEKETVYLMTAEVASYGVTKVVPWITEAELEAGNVCYISAPKNPADQKNEWEIYPQILTASSYNLFVAGKLTSIQALHAPESGDNCGMIAVDRRYLKKVLPSQYTILPHSVSLCVLGEMKLRNKEWGAAKRLFEQADAEGNAYGTYRLAQMNEEGMGQAPAPTEARDLKKRSADMGFQLAQCEWAKDVLYDPNATRAEIALANEYLIKATKLGDYRNDLCYSILHDATYELVSLYHVQKDVLRSFLLTKRLCRDYPSLYYPKMEHIRNCLSLHMYGKARRLIRECEGLPQKTIRKETLEYVFIDHAWMFINGRGEKKDPAEGERLLKYVADRLDFYPAWLELSKFYSSIDRPKEAKFYQSLYDIKYSNRMDKLDEQL